MENKTFTKTLFSFWKMLGISIQYSHIV